jgi:hypothetical protein
MLKMVDHGVQILSLELDTIGLGVATLCISLTCRVVTTFFVVLGSGLNIRERFFVALAWLPKATVQVLDLKLQVFFQLKTFLLRCFELFAFYFLEWSA